MAKMTVLFVKMGMLAFALLLLCMVFVWIWLHFKRITATAYLTQASNNASSVDSPWSLSKEADEMRAQYLKERISVNTQTLKDIDNIGDQAAAKLVEEKSMDDIESQVAAAKTNVASKDGDKAAKECCSICLSNFAEGEKVTRSENKNCRHVFHVDCAHDWLMTSSRTHLEKSLKQARMNPAASDPVELWMAQIPLLCPCCRQDFLLPSDFGETDQGKQSLRSAASASETVSDTSSQTEVPANVP